MLIRDSARLLRDRGHDVQLFTYGYGIGDCPAGLPIRAHTRAGRRTKAGPSLAKPWQDYQLLQTLKRVLQDEPFDCLYAHNYEGLAVALSSGFRPIVYHAHNAMSDELPHYFPINRIPESLGACLDRSLPKRADIVIAPHRRLADYLVDCGCKRDRVHVIPPSTDSVPDSAEMDIRKIAPILYTGNLDAYQNLPVLEATIAHARAVEPDLEWLVATAEAGCALQGATHVSTPDFASLSEALSKDVVVACPRISWSGYPIKLLNAMAAGKAVVACESAAYPLRDGVNGRVVPDDDVEAFAEALLELATDGAARLSLGKAARDTAGQEHNSQQIGAAIESALELAIEKTAT